LKSRASVKARRRAAASGQVAVRMVTEVDRR
jgi:hypothetical protein